MKYLISGEIGDNRKITPQGYLLCTNVPIARIGELNYSSTEIPICPARNGKVTVVRDEETLFNEKTLASFNGTPFTVNHPPAWDNDAMVDAENWKNYAAGFVQCARRGQGEQKNLLLADILVQDQKAIDYINSGLREISVGYTADFIPLEPGLAAQRNFRGNHAALVIKGRAGHQCAIGDSLEEVKKVADKKTLLQSVRDFFTSIGLDADVEIKDKEKEEKKEEKKAVDETPDPESQVDEKPDDKKEPEKREESANDEAMTGEVVNQIKACIEALSARIKRMEDFAAKLAPEEEKEHGENFLDEGKEEPDKPAADEDTEDKKDEEKKEVKVQDEATIDEFIEKVSILLDTALELPDPATDSVEDIDTAICEGKRKVLGEAMKNASHKTVITAVTNGKAIDSLTPEEINTAFRTACVTRHTTAKDSSFFEGIQFAKPESLDKETEEHKKLVTGADLGELYKNHWKK